MKAYSGSTSEGFLPASLPGAAPASTAVAPAPEDPSVTFSDFLHQQTGPLAGTPGSTAPNQAAETSDTAATNSAWTDPADDVAPDFPPNGSSARCIGTPIPVAVPSWPDAATNRGSFPQADANNQMTDDPILASPTTMNSGSTKPAPVSLAQASTTSPADPSSQAAPDNGASNDITFSFAWLNRPASAPIRPSGVTQDDTTSSSDGEADDSATSAAHSFANNVTANTGATTPAPGGSASATPPRWSAGDNALQLLIAGHAAPSAAPSPATPSTSRPTGAATPDDAAAPSTPAANPSASAAAASTPSSTTTSSSSADPGEISLAHYMWLSQAAASRPAAATSAAAAGSTSSVTTGTSPGTTRKSAAASAAPAASSASTAPATPADPATLAGSPLAQLLAYATSLAASARPADDAATGRSVTTSRSAGPSANTSSISASTTTTAATSENSSTLAALVQGQPFSRPVSPEKKSAGPSVERSFTPHATPGATTADTTSTQLASAFAATAQGAGAQTVTFGNSTSVKSTLTLVSGGVAAAGTVNGKKEEDMNATLAMPELVSTTGATPPAAPTSADVHVLLGANTDFHEAVAHIMHIAELSNLSTTSNPLRVAIEIQTPPGAIVNVYVSRQADSSYRAQLSTNDVQALGWVQDQIGSLKGAMTTGTDIRWAPAQLESGTISTAGSSSSNGNDLDWNRGGNQGGNQPSDERPSRNRAATTSDEDELDIPFLETLGAMGGAA